MTSVRSESSARVHALYLLVASMLPLLLLGFFSIQVCARRFAVIYISTTPKETPQGQTVVVIFGVSYAYYHLGLGPAELQPRPGQTQATGSFTIIGSPAFRYIDIPVTPAGKAGEYRAELNWPLDAPVGKEMVYINKDSLYDGEATGPERDTSHIETPDPTDNSEFLSRSANPIVAMFDFVPGGILTVLAVGTSMTFGILLAEFLEGYLEDLLKNLLQKSGQNVFQKLLQKNARAQRFVQELLRRIAPGVSRARMGAPLERQLAYEAITTFTPFVLVFFVSRHVLSSLAFGEIRSDTVSAIAGAIVPWLLSRSGLYKPLQRRFGLEG